jgi:predicted AlkP superfamily phosphohydrolase/phosphomutase
MEKAIWNILSENGKKVITVNVPMTYPPEKVNGIMISGMDAPSINSKFTYPPELYSELKNHLGQYRIHHKEHFTEGEAEDYIKDIEKVTEIQKKACLYLMKNYNWDFFTVVFMALDPIQHFFWKYMDENHPQFDAEKAEIWGDVILSQYQKMDSLVNEFLKNINNETRVFILSDHGHGPYFKTIYFNILFLENDFLKLKNNLSTKIRYNAFKRGLTVKNSFQFLSKIGLANLIAKSSRDTRSKFINTILSYKDIDWDKTKAYSFGNYSQIYINRKTEENADGEKEDYYKTRLDIVKMLHTLKDPGTGEKIVDKVIKKEDVFSGPFLNEAPDLIVRMKDSRYVGYAVGGKTGAFGSNSVFSPPLIGSSAHSMNGVFMIYGKGIKRGVKVNAKIVDIAPTILNAFDLSNFNMDGNILDVFT